jgi:uncharacterized protein YlxW (UPF0749 family)
VIDPIEATWRPEVDALRARNAELQAECDQYQAKLTEVWAEVAKLRAALTEIQNARSVDYAASVARAAYDVTLP